LLTLLLLIDVVKPEPTVNRNAARRDASIAMINVLGHPALFDVEAVLFPGGDFKIIPVEIFMSDIVESA
jgi:hypothetical protein